MGLYFERVQVLSGTDVLFDGTDLYRTELSGSENVSAVPGMTPNHKMAGFVRGNGEYKLLLNVFKQADGVHIDWRNIDYDAQDINFLLLMPSAQYGTNNVFTANSKGILCQKMYLNLNNPLSSPGIGQPASETFEFDFIDWSYV